MSLKRIVPRRRAIRDIDETVAYYLKEAGEKAALGFIDSLERAYRQIRAPSGERIASLRPRTRYTGASVWPLKRYPYLIFFVERDDHVDVWRVLHAERDIPDHMREEGSG